MIKCYFVKNIDKIDLFDKIPRNFNTPNVLNFR